MVSVKEQPQTSPEEKSEDLAAKSASKKELVTHVLVMVNHPCLSEVVVHLRKRLGILAQSCLEKSSKWECASC